MTLETDNSTLKQALADARRQRAQLEAALIAGDGGARARRARARAPCSLAEPLGRACESEMKRGLAAAAAAVGARCSCPAARTPAPADGAACAWPQAAPAAN